MHPNGLAITVVQRQHHAYIMMAGSPVHYYMVRNRTISEPTHAAVMTTASPSLSLSLSVSVCGDTLMRLYSSACGVTFEFPSHHIAMIHSDNLRQVPGGGEGGRASHIVADAIPHSTTNQTLRPLTPHYCHSLLLLFPPLGRVGDPCIAL